MATGLMSDPTLVYHIDNGIIGTRYTLRINIYTIGTYILYIIKSPDGTKFTLVQCISVHGGWGFTPHTSVLPLSYSYISLKYTITYYLFDFHADIDIT